MTPTPYAYTLMISQAVTESVLLERFTALSGRVLRPRAVASLVQDEQGFTVTLDDRSELRARYLVGADGMHSIVRKCVGIGFSGASYEESIRLADVHLTGAVPHDEVILYFSPAGLVVVAPLPDGTHRMVQSAAPRRRQVSREPRLSRRRRRTRPQPCGWPGDERGCITAVVLADALVAALAGGGDGALDGYGAARGRSPSKLSH